METNERKFQVKYEVKIDREATYEKARAKGLKPERGGGRPTKAGESPEAQVKFEFKDFGTTVLAGPNVVQVYWLSDYNDIYKIEPLLNEIVVLMPDEVQRFGEETRMNVPSIRMDKHLMDGYRWKERMASLLGRAAEIKDGRTSDYLRCNKRGYLETAWITLKELQKLIEIGRRKRWKIDKLALENRARLKGIIDQARRSSRDREIIEALEERESQRNRSDGT